MAIRLPVEIWHLIASFSECGALNALSQTSKSIAGVIRPILFETLDLSSQKTYNDVHAVLATLSLLRRDGNLAGKIRILHLPDFERYEDHYRPQLQEGCTSTICQTKTLHSLFLPSPPYSSSRGEDEFVKALRTLPTPLRKLVGRWHDVTEERSNNHPFSSVLEHCVIPFGLILFQSYFFQSVKASQNTLRHLQLPVSVERNFELNKGCPFWQLHFPALRYLGLSFWEPEILEPLGVVTDFFLVHADITEIITFETWNDTVQVAFSNVDGILNLRYLKGHLETLESLVVHYMPQMASSLRSLEIHPDKDDHEESGFLLIWDSMIYVAFKSTGGRENPAFPLMQDLSITLAWIDASGEVSNPTVNEIVDLAENASLLTGQNLQNFSFYLLYPPMLPRELSSALACFSAIKTLALYDTIIQEGFTAEDYAHEVAKVCPQLSMVTFYARHTHIDSVKSSAGHPGKGNPSKLVVIPRGPAK